MTVAPARTRTPGSSTESTTVAPFSTTTPGDSTEPRTSPATRVPPETRLSSTTAPVRMRAALCRPPRVCTGHAGSSRSIGGSPARKSRCACQYAGTVPTSRQ